MTFDNKKQAVDLRIQKSIALIILVIVFGGIYFTNLVVDGALGLTRNQFAGLMLGLFMLYFLYLFLRDYNYIYYSDTGDKLILRYFRLRPLDNKKSAIEFKKSELHQFELQRTFFNLNESLVIFRKTQKGVAKYPPVSLTAIGKQDREKLLSSLKKLIVANKVGR